MSVSAEAETTWTLVLTRGTHTIDAPAAEAILAAIRANQPLVEIVIDLFGDSARYAVPTYIAPAHVVGV